LIVAALAACSNTQQEEVKVSGPSADYQSQWSAGEPIHVKAFCKNLDYTVALAKRFSREEFAKAVQARECGVLPTPIPGVLVERKAWGIDFHGKQSSVWEVRVYGGDKPVYLWIIDAPEKVTGGIKIDPTKGWDV
jgi:hypothetical protein